jgi:hypothetical protein
VDSWNKRTINAFFFFYSCINPWATSFQSWIPARVPLHNYYFYARAGLLWEKTLYVKYILYFLDHVFNSI